MQFRIDNILETLFSWMEERSVGCLKREWHRKGQKYYYTKYQMTLV